MVEQHNQRFHASAHSQRARPGISQLVEDIYKVDHPGPHQGEALWEIANAAYDPTNNIPKVSEVRVATSLIHKLAWERNHGELDSRLEAYKLFEPQVSGPLLEIYDMFLQAIIHNTQMPEPIGSNAVKALGEIAQVKDLTYWKEKALVTLERFRSENEANAHLVEIAKTASAHIRAWDIAATNELVPIIQKIEDSSKLGAIAATEILITMLQKHHDGQHDLRVERLLQDSRVDHILFNQLQKAMEQNIVQGNGLGAKTSYLQAELVLACSAELFSGAVMEQLAARYAQLDLEVNHPGSKKNGVVSEALNGTEGLHAIQAKQGETKQRELYAIHSAFLKLKTAAENRQRMGTPSLRLQFQVRAARRNALRSSNGGTGATKPPMNPPRTLS